MLSKRIFWLTCAAVASWLIWVRLRQRHDDFATTTPQFAPPRTFTPPIPAAPPARQPDLKRRQTATPASYRQPAADPSRRPAPQASTLQLMEQKPMILLMLK